MARPLGTGISGTATPGIYDLCWCDSLRYKSCSSIGSYTDKVTANARACNHYASEQIQIQQLSHVGFPSLAVQL